MFPDLWISLLFPRHLRHLAPGISKTAKRLPVLCWMIGNLIGVELINCKINSGSARILGALAQGLLAPSILGAASPEQPIVISSNT